MDFPLAVPGAWLGGPVPGAAPGRPADPTAARTVAAPDHAGASQHHRLEHAGRLRPGDDSVGPRPGPRGHDAGALPSAFGVAARPAAPGRKKARASARARPPCPPYRGTLDRDPPS